MMSLWSPFRRSLSVACTVDIEQTRDNLFAHVALDGIEVGPGDEVLIHDAPDRIEFGARIRCRCRATIRRASRLERAWTYLTAPLGLAELYEVGFLARRLP